MYGTNEMKRLATKVSSEMFLGKSEFDASARVMGCSLLESFRNWTWTTEVGPNLRFQLRFATWDVCPVSIACLS